MAGKGAGAGEEDVHLIRIINFLLVLGGIGTLQKTDALMIFDNFHCGSFHKS